MGLLIESPELIERFQAMKITKITIEIKSQYGQTVAHPVCCKAKLFAKIAGTKTLTMETLKNVRALGYEIEQLAPEPLKV
jgi:hypothetical protein